MQAELTLRPPKLDEEDELLSAHRATSPEVPSFLHYYSEGMPLTRYLEVLEEQRRGVNLPSLNHVPSTFLLGFVGRRIVGRVSIRHSLNEFLYRVGGHIGYVVVPEFRRRGYASAMLRQSLRIARDELALGRVLITCDEDNLGSVRTIEKCGGVLENVIDGKRRYWIEVS